MRKLSSKEKTQVLAEVPIVLRKLAEERDMYKNKLASIETRIRIEKLASEMVEKGIETGDVRALADRLEKQAESGQLDLRRLEDAVELVGPDMAKGAHVSEDDGSFSGKSVLEQFILS